ncbi:carbon-nitrogen hydrolase family protein [Humisphaera borealis]|uniref:Carbon-nitrogen hydrolase family protein n=1 Tax=Humisphaera borealis TaxID=2807512 RepID=A0A7M2WTL7_9BACT|nr:carbon-nitrogen hydrolase family protein [Humisphaera borealis]QOV88858.1 carbon-nitrogen hydrolase family protein [Humisphaera borealis]
MEDSQAVIVAAVQMRSELGVTARNLDRLESLVHRAGGAGAKVVVTPECAIPGYAGDDLRSIWHAAGRPVDPWFRLHDVLAVAEPVPGPTTDRLAAVARSAGVYLLAGLVELGGQGEAYNTAVLMSPTGDIVGRHRKRWPWPAIEPAWATPGDTPPLIVPTEYGPVGVAICYDIHRVRRLYARGELWTLLFPAAWIDREPPGKYFDRRFPLVARALGCNLVFANHCLPAATRWQGSGESTIYRADGTLAAQSPKQFEDDVVLASLPCASTVPMKASL